MSDFSLVKLNERHEIIKEIKKHLKKSTKQDVISINIDERLKKVAGEATKNTCFDLAGGQKVEFLFRKNGDIIKVKINGREHPTAGHLMYDDKSIFKIAVEEIGEKIQRNQRKYERDLARRDKKNAGEVGAIATHKDGTDASKTTLSKAKQIEQMDARTIELDEQITQKEGQLQLLKQEYEQLSQR